MEQARRLEERDPSQESWRRLQPALAEQRRELARRDDERDQVDQSEAALDEESGQLSVRSGQVGHGSLLPATAYRHRVPVGSRCRPSDRRAERYWVNECRTRASSAGLVRKGE